MILNNLGSHMTESFLDISDCHSNYWSINKYKKIKKNY